MRTFSKTWLWILIPIAILLPLQFLTMTGFCYSEMRYLSKRELVDRVLFDSDFRKGSITLTQEEKTRIAEDRYSAKYPNFCKVNGRPFDLKGWESLLNSIVGLKFFEVECVYPRPVSDIHEDSTEKFFWSYSSVDACATKIVDTSGSGATEKEYESFLRKNQNFWQEYK